MEITVEALVDAPVSRVWNAYVSPEEICVWNAASDDWHTVRAEVDLRDGGRFCSRMEARDGSFGFDFEGVYSRIEPHALIAYDMGERAAAVRFAPDGDATTIRIVFDAESEHPAEMQREGWQAILDSFKRHVERPVPVGAQEDEQ